MNRVSVVDAFEAARSLRAIVQLGFAVIGLLIVLGSFIVAAIALAMMPSSESGFAEGLVFIVFGLYALIGFVVAAIGLLIPQREGSGIHFSRRQRLLLTYGILAPIVSVLAIPLGSIFVPPVSEIMTSILVYGLVALLISGPLATILAMVSKVFDRIG